MKILIISPSLKLGGIERSLAVLSNYFEKIGHEVVFVSCQKGPPFFKLNLGVKYIENEYKRKSGPRGKILFYIHLISFLKKKLVEVKPNVVLSFGDVFNPLVLFALSRKGYPIFISDRTSTDFPFKPIIRISKRLLYPKATGFIAQTGRMANQKRIEFKNKLNIRIIPNPIKSIGLFPEIAREEQIVYIGRMSKEKGVERLIQAYSKIENKNWHCVLAGDGPQLGELKELVNKLNLQSRVVFLGPVRNVDLLLAQSSIFVLPSYHEGFPNALCEAMAAGLPSICFDCIPYEDIIVEGYNGFVIRGNNLKPLTQVLEELIEDKDLRHNIGTNAKKIADKLKVEVVGQEFLKFFHNQIENELDL